MRKPRTRISTLLTSLLFLASCYNPSDYKGDGALTDRGASAAKDRYELNLAAIILTKKGDYSFHMSRLPHVEMTIGLRLEAAPLTIENLDQKPIESVVRIEMTDHNGNTIMCEEAPLSNWVWSGALGETSRFIYRKGEEKEIRTGPNSSRYEPLSVKADGGWGTYFTPRRRESYFLRVFVIPSGEVSKDVPGTLLVEGGGWK